MKAFFKELFEYNFKFNQKILGVMAENEELVSDRLIQLHSHMINAHSLWNARIIRTDINRKPWDLHSVKELLKMDIENYNSSMAILDGFDLDTQIQYSLSSGKTFRNSIRDILFQIINHSTYHRGQVATECRQCGIEPLLTDWIVYKMKS